jgi:hypothetical protein
MLTTIDAGKWYLTAPCECGGWIAFEESQGPTARVTLPERLDLSCDVCGRTPRCRREDVRHARVRSSYPAPAESPA